MAQGVRGSGWAGLPADFRTNPHIHTAIQRAMRGQPVDVDSLPPDVSTQPDKVDSQSPAPASQPLGRPSAVIFDGLECDLIYEDDDPGFIAANKDNLNMNKSSRVHVYKVSSSMTTPASVYFDPDQNKYSHPLLDRDLEPLPTKQVAFKSGDRLPLHPDTPNVFSSFLNEVSNHPQFRMNRVSTDCHCNVKHIGLSVQLRRTSRTVSSSS